LQTHREELENKAHGIISHSSRLWHHRPPIVIHCWCSFAVHLFVVSLASFVRQVEAWYAECLRGKSVRQQLFLILKLFVAFNISMVVIAAVSIGAQVGQWFGQTQAFAWIIGILVGISMIVNVFAIVKCMMIWKNKIPLPTFQPTELPAVGPPPPMPGFSRRLDLSW
jgi:hypothetical protein